MNTVQAISGRRSIRRFKPEAVSRDAIERILQAGIDAPSAKNRQPWRFVVVTERERDAMAAAMREGLEWMEQHGAETEMDAQLLKGAWYTLGIMEKAPVNIFILNPYGTPPDKPLLPYGERFVELANEQSVGAAIQNMCLAATDMGLGSLWIADVYSAYHTLTGWLGTDDLLVAALSVGYPDEAPAARPRKTVAEVTTWR